MIQNHDSLSGDPLTEDTIQCLVEGIRSSHPNVVVPQSISLNGSSLKFDDNTYNLDEFNEILILGGGKAAGTLAAVLEDVLGSHLTDGAVVTNNPVETNIVEVHNGHHPIPSKRNIEGTRAVIKKALSAGTETLVLVVVTGGGSALLTAPRNQVSLSALKDTTEAALDSGVPVDVVNVLRKHLSRVKGGQFAEILEPATVVGVVLSDFVGNDLSVIASGPITPDHSTFEDAIAAIERFNLSIPSSVRQFFELGADGQVPETPTADHPVFENVKTHIVADGLTAMQGAANEATARGYAPVLLSSRIQGEAREISKSHVAIAEEVIASSHPVAPPAAVISGGELTVTVDGNGQGGPNQEYATSASLKLNSDKIVLASVDTDGRDGGTDAAGALIRSSTTTHRELALDALEKNNTYLYLDRKNSLIRTGKTGTNVNDLRVLLIRS